MESKQSVVNYACPCQIEVPRTNTTCVVGGKYNITQLVVAAEPDPRQRILVFLPIQSQRQTRPMLVTVGRCTVSLSSRP